MLHFNVRARRELDYNRLWRLGIWPGWGWLVGGGGGANRPFFLKFIFKVFSAIFSVLLMPTPFFSLKSVFFLDFFLWFSPFLVRNHFFSLKNGFFLNLFWIYFLWISPSFDANPLSLKSGFFFEFILNLLSFLMQPFFLWKVVKESEGNLFFLWKVVSVFAKCKPFWLDTFG